MNGAGEKTALVTGANSGIGFEAAAQLAEAGWGKVIVACRTIALVLRKTATSLPRVSLSPS